MKLIDKFTPAEKDALENLEAMKKLSTYFRKNPEVSESLHRLTGFGHSEAIQRVDSIKKYLEDSLCRFSGTKIHNGESVGVITKPVQLITWSFEDTVEIRYNSEDGVFECGGLIRKIRI